MENILSKVCPLPLYVEHEVKLSIRLLAGIH